MGPHLDPPPGLRRPRTRPDRVLAAEAYSSSAILSYLRRRRIKATIPEPAGQQGNRLRRAQRLAATPIRARHYKQRNTVERAINKLKSYRAVAPLDTTNANRSSTAPLISPRSDSGSATRPNEPPDRP